MERGIPPLEHASGHRFDLGCGSAYGRFQWCYSPAVRQRSIDEQHGDHVTIYEVARAAGVSTATVSRVINDRRHVREATRQRVEAAMRDLGYVAEEVQHLRMLPLSVLFEPYPRMVRDLARELGKEVELVVDGEDTRADRAVVEALRDPLLHLVRNSLDHGLETRVDRVASGKHPRGRLTLRAARDGNRLVLRVEDDGVGLDPSLLRRAAVRKGFVDEAAAAALSDQGARELIFLSGFTSREVATDISGRGVGLDAVRSSLSSLDVSERRLVSARSHLGSMLDGIETARSVADRYSFSAQVEAALQRHPRDRVDAIRAVALPDAHFDVARKERIRRRDDEQPDDDEAVT